MPRRLKIGIVSQPYDGVRPPRQNSIGISVFEFARNMAPRHDVSVVTLHRPGTEEPALAEGARYHYIPTRLDEWLHRQYDRFHRLTGTGSLQSEMGMGDTSPGADNECLPHSCHAREESGGAAGRAQRGCPVGH